MKGVALIPAYNSEATIKETILSLERQTYPFFEIRVYDNKSSDGTRDIVKNLMKEFPNLRLIENEINVGAEGNFTKCIAEASEDFCLIAHADDIYHPEFIENSVNVFELNDEIVATFCSANEIDSTGTVIGKRFIPKEIKKNEISILNKELAISLFYKYGNFVTCPSVVARSAVFRNKIKTWNGEKYKTSADLDVWIRLLDFGKLAFIDKHLINYRVAEASYSFRVAKVRTNKHDIFKVLEADVLSENAKKYDVYLNFLLNKDCANRFLNTLRTKDKLQIQTYQWEISFNIFQIIKISLSTLWHLKMGVAILGLRALYKMKRFL